MVEANKLKRKQRPEDKFEIEATEFYQSDGSSGDEKEIQ